MSPVHVHLERTVRHDRAISAAASFFIHAAVFFLGGALFVHGAEFGVEAGGGIELDLIAAPEVAASAEEPAPQVHPEVVRPPSVVGDKTSLVPGKDSTTFRSTTGAITEARPNYLRNPAPAYPDESRRKGEEGLVLLSADVDPTGRAKEVRLKQSSGYALLDISALDAIKNWRFEPARVGSLKVDCHVEIPIRFQLKDA